MAKKTKRNKKLTDSATKQSQNEGIAYSRHRKTTWNVVGVAERDLPRFDREQSMAKARSLVENNPFLMGLVQTFVDNVVSTGFRLSMCTKDTPYNKDVEAMWHAEKDDLDIRGVRTWGKLMRCWQYRKTVDGDVGIYHNYIDPVSNKIHVQTIEADRIRGNKFDYLDQGIEFDVFGRPQRYFVGPRPKDQQDITKLFVKGTPIDATDFCLYAHYPTDRADMLRGVSMLLPMFNGVQDISELMNAMLQKIKNAAFLAFKNKIDPSPTGDVWGTSQESDKTNEDGVTRRTRALAPMSMADLAPGEDIEIVESSEPSPNVEQYIRYTFRYNGVSIGMPLEFMLFDLGSLNYSSARALMEMAKRRFRCEQEALKLPCNRVFDSWLEHKIYIGDISVPQSLAKTHKNHRWVTPSWPYLDPQAEIQAQGLALGYGLTTIHRILAENSDMDFDSMIEERKAEIEALAAAGIAVSTGLPGSQPATAKPAETAVIPTPPEEKKILAANKQTSRDHGKYKFEGEWITVNGQHILVTDTSSMDVEEKSADELIPLHEVRDTQKFEKIKNSMEKNGWKGDPIPVVEGPNGDVALTGSHRVAAAKELGIETPVVRASAKAVERYCEANGKTIDDLLSGDDYDRKRIFDEIDEDISSLIDTEIQRNEKES